MPGIAGPVVGGSVLDAARRRAMGLPVFLPRVCLHGTDEVAAGTTPIAPGNTPGSAGDRVLGDADGIVVVPVPKSAQTAVAAKARAEAGLRAPLPRGATILDLLRLRERLCDRAPRL